MKNFTKTIYLSVFLLMLLSNISWGQLLDENFSYTIGTDLTANGWNITGTNASPTVKVTAASINYSGYLSSGIGDEVSLSTSGQDVNKTFTAQTTGVVYTSILVNVASSTTTGDYFFHLGATTIGTTFHGRVFIKKDPSSNNFAFGISKTGAVGLAVFTPYSYVTGTTYLLVLRYTIVSGATNDFASIFVNPTLNAVEPISGWTSSTDNTAADLANIGSVALRQGSASNAAALKIDGIRVATTWADIVGAVSSSPTITTTGSLSAFSTIVGTPSATQTYTVAGSGLTNDIVITAPAKFEISTNSGTNWNTTYTLTQTGGTVSTTTITVRYNPDVAGSHSGNITHTSTGATQKDVAVSGSSIETEPTTQATNIVFSNVTQTTATISWTNGNGSSRAVFLKQANTGTAVPVDGSSGYTANTVFGSGTQIGATGWFCIFNGTGTTVNITELLPNTDYIAMTCEFNGTGITANYNVNTATNNPLFNTTKPVSSPTITITGSISNFGSVAVGGTSAEQSYSVSGSGLEGDITIDAPAGFEISLTTGTGFSTQIVLTQTSGAVSPTTIFIHFKPASAGGFSGNLSHTSQNAVTQDIAVSGTGVGATNYVWNGSVNGLWTTAANWTPERTTPLSNDVLLIYNGSINTITSVPTQTIGQLIISNNTTVNLQTGVTNTLTISGGTGTDLSVEAGSQLNSNGTSALTITLATGATGSILGSMTVSGSAHKLTGADASAITFGNGSSFTTGTGFSSNPFGTAGTTSSIIFASGSRYVHGAGSNPFATAGGLVLFQTGSLFKLVASLTPSFSGRTYADFELDATGANISASGTSALIMDNLTITNGTLNFNMTGTPGHSIKGNIVVNTGAALNFAPASAGTVNLNGSTTQFIGGFSTSINSTININNSNEIHLNKDVTIAGTLNFTSGKLNTNDFNVDMSASTTGITGATSSNYIVTNGIGVLKRTVGISTLVEFPIGTLTSYAPVSLQEATQSKIYTANVVPEVTGSNSGDDRVKLRWTVTPLSGTPNATLKMQWSGTAEGSNFAANRAAYSKIIDITTGLLMGDGVTGLAGSDPYTYTTSNVTSFSPIGIAKDMEALALPRLDITALIQGFYDGTTMVPDNITVELHNSTTPFALVEAKTVALSATGTASPVFSLAKNLTSYYIVIKHRSAVETWSATPQQFTGSVLNYDFTSAKTQAYWDGGTLDPMIQIGTKWCLWVGDISDGITLGTHDGIIESADITEVDNAVTDVLIGYNVQDLTGDDIVESADITIADNNATLVVYAQKPPGAPGLIDKMIIEKKRAEAKLRQKERIEKHEIMKEMQKKNNANTKEIKKNQNQKNNN